MQLGSTFEIWSKLKWQIIFGWLLLNFIHVFVLHFGFEINWGFAITDSLVTNNILYIVSLLLVQFLANYHRKKNRYLFFVSVTLIESFIAIYIIFFILRSIEFNSAYHLFFENSILIRVLFAILIVVSLVHEFLKEIAYSQGESNREIQNQDILKEAELQKLQQQLQPHFLFNSLNSINALIMVNPDEASVMVTKLSEYLRYTSLKKDQQFVTLEEEMSNLNLYLEIEKVRFGHRLHIEKGFAEDCLHWEIPTFILQPIVENAIKFGLYGTTEQVNISIQVSCEEKEVKIKVTNPFEKDMIPPKGTGFGLKGIKRRLYLLYARNDLLEVIEKENLFTATLKIPIKNDQSNFN